MTYQGPKGLMSIELISAQPQELARFYALTLGFPFRRREYGAPYPYFVASNGDQWLTIQDARSYPDSNGSGPVRLGIEVEDLEALRQHLASNGVESEWPLANVGAEKTADGQRWDRWMLTIRDPDGNLVSFRMRRIRAEPKKPSPLTRVRAALAAVDPRMARLWLHTKAIDRFVYRTNSIRVLRRDLSGFTHLVTSREGLYAVRQDAWAKILNGLFFGLSVHQGSIYCFQSHDLIWTDTCKGRIIRLDLEGDRIGRAEVAAKGLANGCHQIDFVGDRLHVMDTYNQAVVRFSPDFRTRETFRPLGDSAGRDFAKGYAHMNSIIARDGRIHLLLHNGGLELGRCSEVIVTDHEFKVEDRYKLPGVGCHNIAILEDGRLLVCDSGGGGLIDREGAVLHVGDMLTRGLSVDDSTIAVGDSYYAVRIHRRYVPGNVHFFDRSFKRLAALPLPAAPTDIRKIDGRDLAISQRVS